VPVTRFQFSEGQTEGEGDRGGGDAEAGQMTPAARGGYLLVTERRHYCQIINIKSQKTESFLVGWTVFFRKDCQACVFL